MLTASLLTILVLIIMGTVSLSKLMFNKASTSSETQNRLNHSLQILSRDLRQALNGFDSGCPNPNNPENVCMSTGSQASVLAFKVIEDLETAGTSLDASYQTIRYDYSKSSKTLTRTQISSTGIASAAQTIATKISAATFKNVSSDPDANEIEISLTSNNVTHKSTFTIRGAPIT